ncbi:hypothetical protein [Halobacteriovorax sp. CON-3]|uniref:hypothetical protein n=1 Tax=Halobacteriovorax sp. CON-3 TaxID=3157710 RepID=UPI00371A3341
MNFTKVIDFILKDQKIKLFGEEFHFLYMRGRSILAKKTTCGTSMLIRPRDFNKVLLRDGKTLVGEIENKKGGC